MELLPSPLSKTLAFFLCSLGMTFYEISPSYLSQIFISPAFSPSSPHSFLFLFLPPSKLSEPFPPIPDLYFFPQSTPIFPPEHFFAPFRPRAFHPGFDFRLILAYLDAPLLTVLPQIIYLLLEGFFPLLCSPSPGFAQ